MTMYLSTLLVSVGDDPDRPRPGRLWLRNAHRVHQRLCMAFPSAERKGRDPAFLAPYAADDFPSAHVHAPRNGESGFLFRIDPVPGASPVITVQSAARPDWEYAFHNARYLLAAPEQVRPFALQAAPGDTFRFRLRANPTRRLCKNSKHPSGEPVASQWANERGKGKRVPVPPAKTREWLDRRASAAGFEVLALTREDRGYVYFNKTGKPGEGPSLFSILFEGTLIVRDAEAFHAAIRAGIGPAKAYGFGLLSVKRIET